jgi:glutamate 5-kinase
MAKRRTKTRRWVVKAGSNMVCSGGPLLLRAWMQQVAQLKHDHKIEVIWVTSGAIASASERVGFARRKRSLPEKQALSALGQPIIMDLYNIALHAVGLVGAQVLLTADDIDHSSRRKNLQNTLNKLLEWGAVPVLNENDAVATEEIQFGDNDSLSSRIARMMSAERLVLLTDVDGLYTGDPRTDRHAELVTYRKNLKQADFAKAGKKSGSSRGTGGMYSKLLAAQNANKGKIITHLMKGDWPNGLLTLAEGKSVGTQIGGKEAPPFERRSRKGKHEPSSK